MGDMKILVFGQAFNYTGGGGVTISNLFKEFKKENLFAIVSDQDIVSYDVCSNYYFLNYKERTPCFFRLFVRRKTPLWDDLSMVNGNRLSTKFSFRIILRQFAFRIASLFGINHFLHKYSFSVEFRKWLDGIGDIDLLYVQYADYASMAFVLKLTNYLKKPLVVHIMDDWIESGAITNVKTAYYELPIINHIWRFFYRTRFTNILQKSNLRFCISESMAVEYQKRYSLKFEWIHNYINVDQWQLKSKIQLQDTFPISYFGSIDIKNIECFKILCEAINKLNCFNIELHIYTRDNSLLNNLINAYPFVIRKPYLNTKDYQVAIQNSFLLILPLGFSKKALKYVKYSFPTKLPEYLISGTPTLILSAKETALAEFCIRTRSAHVVTTDDPTILADQIRHLIVNKDDYNKYSLTGFEISKKLFSRQNIQKKFFQLLYLACANEY